MIGPERIEVAIPRLSGEPGERHSIYPSEVAPALNSHCCRLIGPVPLAAIRIRAESVPPSPVEG